MSDNVNLYELESMITGELVLVEAGHPDDPLVESEAAWRDPTAAQAYAVRLQSLHGAVEAEEAAGRVRGQNLPS